MLLTPTGAAIIVTGLWLLFLVSHIGLGLTSLRDRLGSRRFTIVFAVIAHIELALVVLAHGGLKRIGPWTYFHSRSYEQAMGVVAVAGLTLLVAGIIDFRRAPNAIGASHTNITPLQRVTRHPLMLGLGLWGAAWAAMPTQLVDVAFFAGFPAVALFGCWHQDRKLARRRAEYGEYLAKTSFVPFVAMLRARSWSEGPVSTGPRRDGSFVASSSVARRLTARGAPWLLLPVSAVAAYLLHRNQELAFARFGIPLLLIFITVSTFLTVAGVQRAKQP